MELYVWDGDAKWGMPSMDLESLQLLTYVKFSGAPVTIVKTNNPFRSPLGQLPCFKCTEGSFSDFTKVTTFLRKQNYSCDYELTSKQCSEVIAYEQLLKEKLYPVLMYLWWVEPKSYYDVIHKWFFSNIPFPYKFFYPGQFHKKHKDLIESMFDDEDMQTIETEKHRAAAELDRNQVMTFPTKVVIYYYPAWWLSLLCLVMPLQLDLFRWIWGTALHMTMKNMNMSMKIMRNLVAEMMVVVMMNSFR